MNVVYFDGVCNLCNSAVNFLIDRDKKKRLSFASLQSEAGVAILRKQGLPTDTYDSFLFLKGDQLYTKSDAVLEVVRILGSGWQLLYIFKVIPRTLRDPLYTWVAARRYRWFGKRAECRLPTPELRARFL
ncbi:thiol-disulfide oxidoreductase DCC family protein [Arundinibacter roseus]|uniref:Thiol-disulfide oxidoreductase DCC family protein n=1 Tax=Arundinibacter roseus TaxID=2070510 RepID=A0A4R4KQK4_9BACT|nr:thiol-disulfide oxidoreductase DCC family protein [Arundinibacter roseus]TDB68889.1 thiol-disulfide oxidoreductase DCC family protein [Arundinibacter roseus]